MLILWGLKQIAQYQDGRLEMQDVPNPVAPPGGVLVRTTHSVISIGTEKMKVEQAKMNLLQKINSEKINQNISNDLKDPNGYWVPITYRTRIIVYSKERVSKEELSTYEDLANEKWKGKILVRSSSNAVSYTHLTLPTKA